MFLCILLRSICIGFNSERQDRDREKEWHEILVWKWSQTSNLYSMDWGPLSYISNKCQQSAVFVIRVYTVFVSLYAFTFLMLQYICVCQYFPDYFPRQNELFCCFLDQCCNCNSRTDDLAYLKLCLLSYVALNSHISKCWTPDAFVTQHYRRFFIYD